MSDAVRRYLQQRKPNQVATLGKGLAQLVMESPLAGTNLDLRRRKDYALLLELWAGSARHQHGLDAVALDSLYASVITFAAIQFGIDLLPMSKRRA